MKKFSSMVIASGLLAVAASAGADISYNVAGPTDYRFRGLSQSAQGLAIQGGVDYTQKSGLYLGAWASTIDFDGDVTLDDKAKIELDLYGGYKWTVAGVEWDAGLIRYNYPGSDGVDGVTTPTNEIFFGGTYKQFNGKVYYTNDLAGTGKSAIYLNVGGNFELGQGYVLGVSVGHWSSDGLSDDYSDYRVGVSREFKELKGVKLDLSYVNTTLDPAIKTDVLNSEGALILTASKTF